MQFSNVHKPTGLAYKLKMFVTNFTLFAFFMQTIIPECVTRKNIVIFIPVKIFNSFYATILPLKI